MALVRHSECSVRPLYQRYCLDLALLLYPVSVVFSCRPPNMSLCWGTSAYVLRGKFAPRVSDVKCSGSLVRVRFGYWFVAVLAFVDSTTVDKIFSFNLRPKLIL